MANRRPFRSAPKKLSNDAKLSAPELRQKLDEERQRAIAKYLADGHAIHRVVPFEDDSKTPGA